MYVTKRVFRVRLDVADANVILRSMSILGSLLRVNDTLDDFYKDAVRGTILSPALEYGG